VTLRRLAADNRVVFIPDCGIWAVGSSSVEPCVTMLEALMLAFARPLPAAPVILPAGGGDGDGAAPVLTPMQQHQQLFNRIEYLAQHLGRTIPEQRAPSLLLALLEECAHHCVLHDLHFFLYFGHHTHLADDLIHRSPFDIVGRAQLRQFNRAGAVMVMCGSANNKLKVSKPQQPRAETAELDRRVPGAVAQWQVLMPSCACLMCLRLQGRNEFPNSTTLHFLSHYSLEELMLLHLRPLLPALDPVNAPADRDVVQYAAWVTALVPLEVFLFTQILERMVSAAAALPAAPAAHELLLQCGLRFFAERSRHFEQEDVQFLRSLSPEERIVYARTKTFLAARVLNNEDEPNQRRGMPFVYNRLLMFKSRAHQHPFLLPVSPAAAAAMEITLALAYGDQQPSFDDHVKEVFTSKLYTQDTKGRFLKLYITRTLKNMTERSRLQQQPITIRLRRTNAAGLKEPWPAALFTSKELTLSFSHVPVVEWPGHGLPPIHSFVPVL
jgi:hypothetical protein